MAIHAGATHGRGRVAAGSEVASGHSTYLIRPELLVITEIHCLVMPTGNPVIGHTHYKVAPYEFKWSPGIPRNRAISYGVWCWKDDLFAPKVPLSPGWWMDPKVMTDKSQVRCWMRLQNMMGSEVR
jgi:hypothetical protein